MDGVFPCHKKSLHYSCSTPSSRLVHSPPLKPNTPQRVPRKPVVHNPMLKGSPHELPLKRSPRPFNKNYAAADTIHPNRVRTCSQVTPIRTPSTSPAILSKTEKRIQTRRHSQGSHITQNENDDDRSSSNSSTKSNTASSKSTTATRSTASSISSSGSNKSTTTFWYPRTESQTEPLQPLKRGLSKKLRGLLQPHRTQIEEGATKEQHIQDCQTSLQRCQSPSLSNNDNPFRILAHQNTQSNQYHQVDFSQVDNYASTVQQRGPLLTPTLLSQKFLVRPYRRDLFRLRALFIWVVQNIRPTYHQRRHDLLLLQMQEMQEVVPMTPSKSSQLRHRLSRMALADDVVEAPSQKLDAMHLLEEEATCLLAETMVSSNYMEESADEVLEKRVCKSAFGMAHLFVAMALAAGFEEARVIYGYLKGVLLVR
jgi:hypothetical protein